MLKPQLDLTISLKGGHIYEFKSIERCPHDKSDTRRKLYTNLDNALKL